MIDAIRSYYYKKKDEMDLKRKWKDLLNQLSRHLLEFVSEGRRWLQQRVLLDSEDYLHQVNVKCGWANYLNEEVVKLRKSIVTDVANQDRYNTDLDGLKKVLTDIRLLIKTSLDVVPYSKIDDLNLLVYKIETYISTGCYE